MQRGEWMARFLRCYSATICVLKRIHGEAGYPFKDVVFVDLADYKPCPTWFGGRVEVGYNNEPESLAHEMGHGLHEKITETGKSNFLGEEFAEAIRYYTEREMQTNSPWLTKFDSTGNPFTKRYALDQFVGALKTGDLFREVGWI
ncbi:MAG: hypothetical protein HYX68_15785 [Planctomycetes bacterium]|nr:hypothetical protein [Planctomycetota bacterium]